MRIARRLAKIVVVALLVVILAVAGLVTWVTARALPRTTGDIRIPGLDAEVVVRRDAAGIAHITASTPHDLFLAQGFVHAQERLWQMEVWRHVSAGRVAELFGGTALETDRFIRTLGWRQAAERDLASFAPETVAVLEAYAEGVNAFIEGARGSRGMAFVVGGALAGRGGGIGGFDPEPWTVLDSVAWQKVQAWSLGGNFSIELFNLLADARLGDLALTDDLRPGYDDERPVITPPEVDRSRSSASGAAVADAAPRGAAVAAGPRDAIPATVTGGRAAALRRLASAAGGIARWSGLGRDTSLTANDGLGSNNWVVAPERSATGAALLGNDPHLGLSMPSVWYALGLHCRPVGDACPYDVTGVSFPGDPGVILGHNARIAWGATNLDPDVQDLVLVELDPEDPAAYLDEGVSTPLGIRREEIRVAGGQAELLEVLETADGPIVNAVVDDLREAPPMTLRWTALAEADGTLEAILRINTAQTFEEFRDALRRYGSPAQNFVYADIDGHIGYQMPGFLPIRAPGDRSVRPVPAGEAHAWRGRIPFDELPWQLDPPGGLIVSANNAPVAGDYPYALGSDWDYGDRAARIHELLGEATSRGVTMEDMRRIQLDDQLRRAERLVPALLAAGPTPATPEGAALLDEVRDWDRSCGVESRGCAAYLALEFRLLRAIFDDELGPLARDYVGGGASIERLTGLLTEPTERWWDDVTTTDVTETPASVIGGALDATAAELRRTLGAPEDWAWGRLHPLALQEESLGTSGIGPLEWYFNAPSRPAPGAAGALNNLYYDLSRAYPDPDEPETQPLGLDAVFGVTNGPSVRLLVDLADFDGARIVQTTGQAGNPFDRHYGDMVEPFLRGDSHPLPFSAAAVEAAAVETLVLRP